MLCDARDASGIPQKDAENQRKHEGITFADACCVFDDPLQDVVEDDGDYGEDRFIAAGRVGKVILVVAFTERNGRERIISARKAEPREASVLCPSRTLELTTSIGIPRGERTGHASKP